MADSIESTKGKWWQFPDLHGSPRLSNDGARTIMCGDEVNAKAVARVLPQIESKRGEAWKVDCPERDANARLVAAAPDLYYSIKNLLNGIDTGLVRLDTVADETLANAMRDIRAAVARVKG